MQALQTTFWSARDYLAPVLKESKFKEHGRITPDEFVAAGDFLVYKFPTWAWGAASDKSKRREYLPEAKQYLVQRNVPCLRRVKQLAGQAEDEAEETVGGGAEGGGPPDAEEDWVATHVGHKSEGEGVGTIPSMDDIPDADEPTASSSHAAPADRMANMSLHDASSPDAPPLELDDIPDMDDDDEHGLGGGIVEVDDPAAAAAEEPASTSDNLLSVRTYDCYITYDKYYQTPRMYLSAFDEHKRPLAPALIFQDISADYAQKTVTIEPFPALAHTSMASVHPCKHANVMKRFIERMNTSIVEAQRRQAGGGADSAAAADDATGKKSSGRSWGVGGLVKKATGGASKREGSESGTAPDADAPEGLRVDQYLIVFLKFMSSIMPTIEVDSTAAF